MERKEESPEQSPRLVVLEEGMENPLENIESCCGPSCAGTCPTPPR